MRELPVGLSRNCMVPFLCNVHLLVLLATHQILLGRGPCSQVLTAAGSGHASVPVSSCSEFSSEDWRV